MLLSYRMYKNGIFLEKVKSKESVIDFESFNPFVKGALSVKIIQSLLLVTIMLLAACTDNNSSADWAHSFVVWQGYIYHVTEEYVDNVDEEIGAVTMYSDMEGTYEGNFSNVYKKGTKYFSIRGMNTDVAIAIETEKGEYRKAIRAGEYGEQ